MKMIGSKESGKSKYMVCREYKPGQYCVSASTWDRYVDRCRNAGETPLNPEEEGIVITSDKSSPAKETN
jgi:hypothetical protein